MRKEKRCFSYVEGTKRPIIKEYDTQVAHTFPPKFVSESTCFCCFDPACVSRLSWSMCYLPSSPILLRASIPMVCNHTQWEGTSWICIKQPVEWWPPSETPIRPNSQELGVTFLGKNRDKGTQTRSSCLIQANRKPMTNVFVREM